MNFDSALAQALFHSLWQETVLALSAALVLGALARRGAALRHAVGMAFLFAMVLLPAATFAWLALGPTLQTITLSTGPSAITETTVAISRPLPVPAPLWLPWLWFTGVAVMLTRLVGGWWMVRGLDRRAFRPLPEHWEQRARALARAMGIRRRVAVRVLEDFGIPCSTRALRPVIWLPMALLTQLSPEQFEALLAHELAHVHRLDWIWNGLQCLVEALFFYHPGVWWLSRRVRQEREIACDDLAVALCGDAIALAEALATLEGRRPQRPAGPLRPAPHLAPAANGGSLMNRIQHLLSPPPPSRLRWSLPAGLLVALGSGALLLAQAHRPADPRPPAQGVDAPAFPDLALGSSRMIEDDSDGVRRVYRQHRSLGGVLTESYTENGQARPLDAAARQWISDQARRAGQAAARAEKEAWNAQSLAQRAEAEARRAEAESRREEAVAMRAEAEARGRLLPPLPPPPPPPPAPPEPPSFKDSIPCQQALSQAQADARLQAALGSPIRLAGTEIKGSMTTWGPGDAHSLFGLLPSGSKAEMHLPLTGPKGSATLHATGRLIDGTWKFSRLEAVPAQGTRLNLLAGK